MLVHSLERASRKSVSSTKREARCGMKGGLNWMFMLFDCRVYGIDRFDSRTNFSIHKGEKVQSIIGPCMFFVFLFFFQ